MKKYLLFTTMLCMLQVMLCNAQIITKKIYPTKNGTYYGLIKSLDSNNVETYSNQAYSSDVFIGYKTEHSIKYYGRGCLHFDLSAIPQDVEINSASLQLFCKTSSASNFDGNFDLREIPVYFFFTDYTSWVNLEQGNKVGSFTFNRGNGYQINNLKNYIISNGLLKETVLFSLKHKNESSKLMNFEMSDSNCYLEIKYTIPPPAATLSISGPDEIREDKTATYTANYTGTATNYQWSSVNNRLNILSGQGTNRITISPKIAAGTDQLKVTVGGLSATKNVTIKSATTTINENITVNKNFSNRFINVSNTNISNNAVVNITAEERVRITPNFRASQGTKVIIKATGSGALRSSSIIEEEKTVLPEENVFEVPGATSVSDVIEIPQPVRINIYSITGLPVYSSTTEFDIKSVHLNQGIYIVETINDRGEIKREKISIGR